MSDIEQVDRTEFLEILESASVPLVAEFYAEWCETCQELEPVLEELAEEYDGTVRVITVELEEEGRLANQFHIADVPTFIALYRGNSLERQVGDVTADDLEAMFENLVDLPRVAA